MDQCSVTKTIDIIGGKWKAVALYYMLARALRFNELKRLMPTITQRMLTLQLRELERDGLVTRTVYPQVPPKVEYSLTPLGYTLRPILELLRDWGTEHGERVLEIRSRAA
jgi:DNA-binding HxlR family transcriptional regulator